MDNYDPIVLVGNVRDFLGKEWRPRQWFRVYNDDHTLLWMYTGFVYIKRVPTDTSVFQRIPSNIHIVVPAQRLVQIPQEHLMSRHVFVRNFKYECTHIKRETYKWLRGFRGSVEIGDTHVPRCMYEQLRGDIEVFANAKWSCPRMDPRDPVDIHADPEVEAWCYMTQRTAATSS